jgi:hypothetical protein
LSLARSARPDESWSGWSGERRFAAGSRAHGRRAGRPAAARQRIAGSASACSAATESGRAPGAQLAPAGTGTDPADILVLERNAHGRATEGRRAGEVGDGDFRAGGARIQHRLLGGRLGRGQPQASSRSSVGHLAEHPPNAAAGVTSGFAHRPVVFRPASIGVERGGGVAVQPGVGRFAAARGRRAIPGRWRTPGRAAWRSRTFAWVLDRAKAAVLSPRWKLLTQEWGPFRTLNWTPNLKSRAQRERRAPGRRAQNGAISRQNEEMARPGIEPGTPRFSVVCSTD